MISVTQYEPTIYCDKHHGKNGSLKMFYENYFNLRRCLYFFLVLFFLGKLSVHAYASQNFVRCADDMDCERFNGTCREHHCYCNFSYHCNLNENPLVNRLGESCELAVDCNMDFVTCNQEKKCSCLKGYVPSADRRKCLKMANRLSDECQENVQCYSKTPSTICKDNKCVCQQHMHEFNGSCYKNVGLGESCQLFGECSEIPNATCFRSYCECLENFVSNGTSCLLKANGINFTCSHDVQCKAQLNKGGECFNKACRCREDYQYKASLNQCVHDIFLNEKCGRHSECHQPGTDPNRLECILGVCKCRSPFLEESGFCMNSSTPVVVFNSIILFLGTMFLMK